MTLADLLASLAVLALVLAATFSLLDQGQRLYAYGAARVEAQQTARLALERMAAEIRQAGRGGAGAPFGALSVAERSRIVIHLDVNDDGVIVGNGETITWLLRGRVLRRDAGGGAQPIINGVRDLELTYFDAAGQPTAVPGEVRSVGIALTTEPDHAGAPARPVAARVATQVRLRNR